MKENKVECASVPCWLPESLARRVDDLHKRLPVDCGYVRKAYQVDYQFEPGERAEVSVITSASRDKTDEVVLPEGMELDSYRKNMIVLWNHDHEKPVARCGWIKLHKGEIRAKTIYPESEDGTNWSAFVDDVWAMTKACVLRQKSVGFLPLTPKRAPTQEELAEHPDWEGAGVFDNTLLLEYSCVSVGCNNDCLVEAINTKSLDVGRLASLGLEIPQQATPVEKFITPVAIEPLVEKIITRPSEPPFLPMAKGADLKEALAYALTKGYRPKPKPKKVDWDALVKQQVEKALAQLDVEKIIARAFTAHKHKGRA